MGDDQAHGAESGERIAKTTKKLRVLSLGAGVQSTTLALMTVAGESRYYGANATTAFATKSLKNCDLRPHLLAGGK